MSAALCASSGLSFGVSSLRLSPTTGPQPLPPAASSQPAPLPASRGPPCPCSAMAARLNCAEQSPSSASDRKPVVAASKLAPPSPPSAAWKLPGAALSAGSLAEARAAARSSTVHIAGPCMSLVPLRSLMASTLHYRGHAHAASRTHGDEPALGVAIAGQQLRQSRDDARAGRGKGMTEGDAATLNVDLGTIDAAEGGRQSQHLATVVRRLPRLERTQHLRCERLVDLVVVEVLERDAGIAQHGRHGIGGCHEQSLLAADEIHGPRLAVGEVGEH